MGAKTSVGEIPLMILFLRAALLATAFAASSQREITLRSSYETSPDALTTDRILEIDADAINPHRMRWALKREVKLLGIKGIANPKFNGQKFGVQASTLE